MFAQDDSLPA